MLFEKGGRLGAIALGALGIRTKGLLITGGGASVWTSWSFEGGYSLARWDANEHAKGIKKGEGEGPPRSTPSGTALEVCSTPNADEPICTSRTPEIGYVLAPGKTRNTPMPLYKEKR